MTHTKGPWKANKEEEGQWDIDAWFDESVTVAVVLNEPEAQANARLIAAAPELLEALESVYASAPFASYRGDGELEECEQRVQEAIRKAKS